LPKSNDPNSPNYDPNYDPNDPNNNNGNSKGGVLIPESILKEFDVQHIYYDLDKSYIRPDAALELDKIVALMYQNPGIQIELGSHTDSRGSDDYNLDLSERRAQAAVDYIISKGIPRDRITARGYGETQLVNSCSNGVSCSDAEHQQNRRTEFKIIGYSTNAISSAPRYYGTGLSKYGGNDATNAPSANDYFKGEEDLTPFDEPTTTTTYETTPFDDSSSNTTYDDNTSYESESTTTYNNNSNTSTQHVGGASSADVYDSNSPTIFDEEVRYDEFGNPINALEYKIQLGAFKNPSLSRFESLNDLGYIEIESSSSSAQKVVLGKFVDKGFAYDILQQVRDRGFRDAFIVVYQNGERM